MLLIVHTVELKLFHSIRNKPRLSAETLVASISEDVDFTDFTLVSKNGDKFPVHRNVSILINVGVRSKPVGSCWNEKRADWGCS